MGHDLEARWVRPDALTTADLRAWRELAARAVDPNPFFEPEMVLPAARALPSNRLRLLVAADGSDWHGMLPLRSVMRWRRLPWPALATWAHDYSFLGTPLLSTGAEHAAARTLVAAARDRAPSCVALEQLPADGPAGVAMDAALSDLMPPAVEWDRSDRAALHRRPENDYVASMLKSRRRRELRRLRKQLEAELGAPLVTVDRSDDPAGVEAFLGLEAAGWKGRRGSALSAARAGGFFRDACDGFRSRGRLQLLSLQAGETVVAMKCNFIATDGLFCFKIAYDETVARFSPGVQLELDNVDVFHDATTLRWMDSCADPDNGMINRLWPDRRQLVTLLVPPAGPTGRLVRDGAGVAARLRKRVKEAHA